MAKGEFLPLFEAFGRGLVHKGDAVANTNGRIPLIYHVTQVCKRSVLAKGGPLTALITIRVEGKNQEDFSMGEFNWQSA